MKDDANFSTPFASLLWLLKREEQLEKTKAETMSSSERKPGEISEGDDSIALWRVDPNFSDWTLEITEEESGVVTTYHVHRATLALGSRKSEYFAGLFRSEALRKAEEQVTRIELGAKVAKVVPLLLDYVYNGQLDDDAPTLVPLFSLADYFLIDSLQKELKGRLQGMTGEQADAFVIYYRDAVALGHEETLATIAAVAESYCRFSFDSRNISPLLKVVDCQFVLRFQNELLYLVHRYLSIHEQSISTAEFRLLLKHVIDVPDLEICPFDVEMFFDVAKDAPNVKGYPEELQKLLVMGVEHLQRKQEKYTPIPFTRIMEVFSIAQSVSDWTDENKSALQTQFMLFFTENPASVKHMTDDWLMRLHEFLSSEQYAKLSLIVLQQYRESAKECRRYRKQVRQKEGQILQMEQERELGELEVINSRTGTKRKRRSQLDSVLGRCCSVTST